MSETDAEMYRFIACFAVVGIWAIYIVLLEIRYLLSHSDNSAKKAPELP